MRGLKMLLSYLDTKKTHQMTDQKYLNPFAFVRRSLESYLWKAFWGYSRLWFAIYHDLYPDNPSDKPEIDRASNLNNPLVLYRLAISQTMIQIALHILYLIDIADRSYQSFSIIHFLLALEALASKREVISQKVVNYFYFKTNPFLVVLFWLNSTASTYIFIAGFTLFLFEGLIN